MVKDLTGAELYQERQRRSYVKEMFTAIAPRYDLLNHVLSLNIDRNWRRAAIDCLGWEDRPLGRYLDVCAGTLDLGIELERRSGFEGRVVGADFVVPMLQIGRRKGTNVMPVGADALGLPFPGGAFDGAMVAFGIRNLTDLDAGLAELHRVLKPGSRLVVLEFAIPERWLVRQIYLLYFTRILPWIGRVVSRHGNAYSYLPDSVLDFPEPDALAECIRARGFIDVRYRRLTMGIAALHWAQRQD